jgi:hypothetical protein
MADDFQKLLVARDAVPAVLSLNVQAAMGPVREAERSQFALLMRHFLERFFNHETASPDGDGKTLLVQLAFAAGIPGFMVGLFLWPIYHPVIVWPPHPDTIPGPPPYWVQMNHHFFFVLYSFVAMGLITVFEWDLFFPDLLDVLVLGTLPLDQRRIFLGRAAAIGIFIVGFLFDANFLASLMFPVVADPVYMLSLLAGHIAGVAASGLFAAIFIVALQSLLLAVMGERLFRKISLVLQGGIVTVLVMLLLLFPVLSAVTPALLQSHNSAALWFPPFWFLGMYQMMLDSGAALPVFHELAGRGCAALVGVAAIGMAAYPLAYFRRVRYLLVGAPPRARRNSVLAPLNGLLHACIVRGPIRRAVFHFINQTLLRVQRYRIYLVLYGGVGLSVLIATVLRLTVVKGHLRAEASADGIRVAVGIVAFWVTTGLRTAFVSPGNQRGNWIFRFTHGRPANFDAAMDELAAAKLWVLLCALTVTEAAVGVLRMAAPAELLSLPTTAAQLLVGAGVCVLLTDAFFANVMMVPFTGEPTAEMPNIAFTLLKFFTFFPLVTAVALVAEQWIEEGWQHFGAAVIAIVVCHLWFRYRHREQVRIHSAQAELEEGEDDFPMRLGLRY